MPCGYNIRKTNIKLTKIKNRRFTFNKDFYLYRSFG
jgi:hypothetical protein